jgi:hypothetical protein
VSEDPVWGIAILGNEPFGDRLVAGVDGKGKPSVTDNRYGVLHTCLLVLREELRGGIIKDA